MRRTTRGLLLAAVLLSATGCDDARYGSYVHCPPGQVEVGVTNAGPGTHAYVVEVSITSETDSATRTFTTGRVAPGGSTTLTGAREGGAARCDVSSVEVTEDP